MSTERVNIQAYEWHDLVDQILPKVLVSESAGEMEVQREYRVRCALELAAVALCAAGEHALADSLLDLEQSV